MNNHPLVSVIIVTYNSADYVLDALESVKEQTYDNIELIVSDDCSKDDTVQICGKWLEANKTRFVNYALITIEKNTGTSANCNRGLAACKGEWFKLFAGDDALCPNCIEDFVGYVNENAEAKFVLGDFEEYKDFFIEENKGNYHERYHSGYLDDTADKQFNKMVHGSFILPCATFLNTEMLRGVGGFDEKYGIMEDFPLYLKLLKSGYRCYKMDIVVAKYRMTNTNVWGHSTGIFNYNFKKMEYLVVKDMCFPYYSKREKMRYTWHHYCYEVMHFLHLTEQTRFNAFIWKTISRMSSIFKR